MLPLPRPAIKSAVVIFAPAFTRRMMNPAFGRLPQRDRRLPVGPSAADEAEIKGSCPATAPTLAEEMDHFYGLTMSAAEYADFTAHARSAMLDRYAACEPAELDEMGISPAAMEELARESAELDAVCGQSFTRQAPSPVATARKPRRKVETLHTRHRAAAKAGV